MASAHDMKAARETYGAFISAIKWSTPFLAALTALVVYLISR